jgi:hypothetical protein
MFSIIGLVVLFLTSRPRPWAHLYVAAARALHRK